MCREVNKFGVPYHAYTLRLDDGTVVDFEMAWEEHWGNVSEWCAELNCGRLNEDGKPLGYQNDGAAEAYVGYGNEVDGYRKIMLVWDDESNRYVNPFEFLRRAEKYVSCYSE